MALEGYIKCDIITHSSSGAMETKVITIEQNHSQDALHHMRAESYRSHFLRHIAEGLQGERRLYISCGNNQLILSSQALENKDIRYDPSSRALIVDTTYLARDVRGLFDSARYRFELRVGQHMSDFDRSVLEGIMALATNNDNYMLARGIDPHSLIVNNPGRLALADIGRRQEPAVIGRQDAQVIYPAPERRVDSPIIKQKEVVKNPIDAFLDTLIAKVRVLLNQIGKSTSKPRVHSRPAQVRKTVLKEAPSLARAPELVVRQGRSGEDWADSIPLTEMAGNPWGIEVLAGVADGFSKPDEQALEMAQATIRTFWEQLKAFVPYAANNQDLSKLLPEIARRTNLVLTQRYEAQDKGVCADIAVKTRDQLHILHIGEGRGYWRKGRGLSEWHIPVHTVPSFPLPDGKVGHQRLGGDLKVNRAFGAARYVQYGLNNSAEHYVFDLDKLRKAGISELLLTSDGIDELLRYAADHNILEAAVYFGLNNPEFKRRLDAAAKSITGIDDVAVCRVFLN